jgi:hypothetical protein
MLMTLLPGCVVLDASVIGARASSRKRTRASTPASTGSRGNDYWSTGSVHAFTSFAKFFGGSAKRLDRRNSPQEFTALIDLVGVQRRVELAR